jgi:hypothetical protein
MRHGIARQSGGCPTGNAGMAIAEMLLQQSCDEWHAYCAVKRQPAAVLHDAQQLLP